MALSKLDSLYMAVVADHSKHPYHQGLIEDVDHPSQQPHVRCDSVECEIFDGELFGGSEDIALHSGCTISTASASMMMML